MFLLRGEDDVLEVGRRELPALWRSGDVDVHAFSLDAYAVWSRLLLRGEGAGRAKRVRLARVRVDGRSRAAQLDDGHTFGHRIALGGHLLRVKAMLLEVLDRVGERVFRGLGAAAGGQEEDEQEGYAHGPSDSEGGTRRDEEV